MSAEQALQRFRDIRQPIDKYLYLRQLLMDHGSIFYSLLIHNVHEILPYVYTPTVGEACQKYHRLPGLQTWGLYITLEHKGSILQRLQQWPQKAVQVAVATDGERILGLGDLGAGGMGIAEGKIMLYTVAAGVNPDMCCPICLDIGTNNEALLSDPDYKGLRQRRPPRKQYDAFMAEFMQALRQWQPHLLLQFEDFHNTNAFRLLKQHQLSFPCFNDDIQGTACVALAGILSAMRATSKPLSQHLLLFLGAGEAGVGIGELVSHAIAAEAGCSLEAARQRCCFVDSKGLVVQSRQGLQSHKTLFAHDMPPQPDFLAALHALKPSIIVGVSTSGGAFNQEVLQAMADYNDRPIVFPLSNPTQLSECTFKDALRWTDSRVLFASGSPFQPEVSKHGRTMHPAQANNAYVFPAVGHAAVLSQAKAIPDEVFLVAAKALSHMTSEQDLEAGWIFPSFDRVLATSKVVMKACCEYFEANGVGCKPTRPWAELIDQSMWVPQAPSKL